MDRVRLFNVCSFIGLLLTVLEYQTCVSILFVGYIIGQIPSNLIINRVKPRMFMVSFEIHTPELALNGLGAGHDGLGGCERADSSSQRLHWSSLD